MRKPRAVVVIATAAAVALVLGSTSSCLDPTQITLEITTDAPCSDVKGTSIAGGATIAVESATPSTTTNRCVAGDIGTLVGTPSDTKDSNAFFVVAVGVDRPVAECNAANKFKGCIVQRRALRYVKHRPINLPIKMWLVCKDKECDANSTCARNGKCVPALIADPERCADGPCYPTGDAPEDFPDGDASVEDGAVDGDGGPISDGPIKDGDADSSFVVPPPPPAGKLYCPPIAAGCDKPINCCWNRDVGGGNCNPGGCTASEIPLSCNRQSDCPASELCCGSVIAGVSVVKRDPPPGPSAQDARVIGDRTLISTSCTMPGIPCGGTYICTTPADCPPTAPNCNTSSDLFVPTGIFGECVP